MKLITSKIKILLFLCLNLVSCNQFDIKNYPKSVTLEDGFIQINSRYEIEVNDFHKFPKHIQGLAQNYLIDNIGDSLINKSEFNYGKISSNTLIKKNTERNLAELALFGNDFKIDTTYVYPVYSICFKLSLPKKGINNYDLNFMMDNDGNIIKDIGYPKFDFKNNSLFLFPIDSIHRLLINQ